MIILSQSAPTSRLLMSINMALGCARGNGNRALRRMERNLRITDAQICRAREIVKRFAVKLPKI